MCEFRNQIGDKLSDVQISRTGRALMMLTCTLAGILIYNIIYLRTSPKIYEALAVFLQILGEYWLKFSTKSTRRKRTACAISGHR